MSGSLARKACARCGEESLAQEWACWACGMPFASPGSAPTMLPAPRRIGGQTVAAAVGLFVLLIGIGIGFWIGRASQPSAPDRAAAASAPVPASIEMIPPPSLSGGRPDTPVRLPPPGGSRPPADPWRRALPAVPPAPPRVSPPGTSWSPPGATLPGAAPMPRVSAPRPAVPLQAQRPTVPTASAAPAAKVRSRVRAGEALILAHNRGGAPLQMTLHGSDTHTVLVAPGASVPISVPAGDYRLTLIGGSRREVRRSVTLKAGEQYPIRFP